MIQLNYLCDFNLPNNKKPNWQEKYCFPKDIKLSLIFHYLFQKKLLFLPCWVSFSSRITIFLLILIQIYYFVYRSWKRRSKSKRDKVFFNMNISSSFLGIIIAIDYTSYPLTYQIRAIKQFSKSFPTSIVFILIFFSFL